jgi:hypothetical protein
MASVPALMPSISDFVSSDGSSGTTCLGILTQRATPPPSVASAVAI